MHPTDNKPSHSEPGQRPPGHDRAIDREINLRAVTATVVGIFVLTVVAMVLMWVMFEVLLADEQSRDPAPPPLAAAAEPTLPPGPRLQASPEAELEHFRAEENQRLSSYGWKDRDGGVVRIPIGRAMEVLAEQGLDAMSTALDPAAGDVPEDVTATGETATATPGETLPTAATSTP